MLYAWCVSQGVPGRSHVLLWACDSIKAHCVASADSVAAWAVGVPRHCVAMGACIRLQANPRRHELWNWVIVDIVSKGFNARGQ